MQVIWFEREADLRRGEQFDISFGGDAFVSSHVRPV